MAHSRTIPARRARARSPRSRAALYAAILALAALLTASLVLASQLGASDSDPPEPVPLAGAAETERLLAGLPQAGTVLGDPKAPVTLVEYADLQCPYCAQWAREAFPALVSQYVRAGKLRIVFRGLAFIGPESETALRTALAAGGQRKLWNLVHLLYRNQGSENGGWVTDDLLELLGRQVPGLDAERMLAERSTHHVEGELATAARQAAAAGIMGTPSFQIGRTGGELEPLEIASLDANAIRPAIDALLRR